MGIVSLIHVIVGFGLPEASHTNTACRAFSTTWGWEYRYSWCENDNANVGNVDNVEQIWMTMLIHDENTFMAGFWIICGKPAGRAFSAKRNNVFRVLNSLRSSSFLYKSWHGITTRHFVCNEKSCFLNEAALNLFRGQNPFRKILPHPCHPCHSIQMNPVLWHHSFFSHILICRYSKLITFEDSEVSCCRNWVSVSILGDALIGAGLLLLPHLGAGCNFVSLWMGLVWRELNSPARCAGGSRPQSLIWGTWKQA